jgi:hypothetical protein
METVLDDEDADAARSTLEAQEDVVTTRGDVVRGDSSGDAERLALGAEGEALTSDGSDSEWAAPDYKPNAIINGGFNVWQRGTSFTAATTPANGDDTYLMDRWLLLSDGDDIVDVSHETTVKPDGSHSALKLLVATQDKRYGILQIIEGKNCAHLVDGKASLSFKALRDTAAILNIGAAVVAWGSTEDTIAATDIVNSWTAEPTLVANWTYEHTTPIFSLSSAWQTFKIEDISIRAGTTNLAVFIWTSGASNTAGDICYIADVQLVPGTSVGASVQLKYGMELASCQRYFTKTFPQATAPAQDVNSYLGCLVGQGDVDTGDSSGNAGIFEMEWRFKQTMLAAPTITLYNPDNASATAANITDGPNTTRAVSAINIGDDGCGFTPDGAASGDEGDDMALHATAEAEL